MIEARILIVEDELIAAKSLELRLNRLGYTVVGSIAFGEQVLSAAQTLRADLVLMDINLRGDMDGIQAAEQIRTQLDIPVIFTTSHDDDQTLHRAKITDPFGYLVKPFETREVRTAIEMALYKHATDRKLRESEQRYRIISELVSDYTYSGTVDAEGRITFEWITDAFAKVFGYSMDELNQMGSIFPVIFPEDQAQMQQRSHDMLAGNARVDEYRVQTKQGEVRWIRHYVRPVWDAAQQRVTHIYGGAQDITDRKHAQDELARDKVLLEQLFENAPIGIVMLDEFDRVKRINAAFERIFQYSLDEIAGKPINDLIVPTSHTLQAARLSRKILHGETVHQESVRQRRDGSAVLVEVYGIPVLLKQRTIGLYGMYVDITERKRAEEQLQFASTHDALTGIYNRAYFETQIEKLHTGSRYPVSIVMVDVDRLKQTNDTLGHAAGDRLLRDAATVLRSAFRNDDIVARIGGDEFAVLLPGTDFAITAEAMARVERVLDAHNADTSNLPLSFSMGAATAMQGALLGQAMIDADAAMYQHKMAKHVV